MGIPYVEGFDIHFGLSGKTAIITGAASGIGRAIALMFAKKGANVVLVDKSDDVRDVGDIINGGAIDTGNVGENGGGRGAGRSVCIVGDITGKGFHDNIVNVAAGTFGGIDILVNCAGIVLLDEAENLSEEYWDLTMDVNLKAAFILSQAVGRHMIRHGGGKIINIASQASVISLDRHVAYCASKAGLVSVTQVLAAEWAEYGICVNAISPTVVLTELGKKAWAGEVGEAMKKLIPAGRFGYPEEIAACASYLASDAANLITGANIVIDGGFTIK
ncbi:MAG: D-threitol dehydrogenase [Oscillospiraceae bacterium]|nr:D-threitol dehydrogenase [Oscillospiraceae bacterium]